MVRACVDRRAGIDDTTPWLGRRRLRARCWSGWYCGQRWVEEEESTYRARRSSLDMLGVVRMAGWVGEGPGLVGGMVEVDTF